MGQKVNPHGMRVGVTRNWDSYWYPESNNENLSSEKTKFKIGRIKAFNSLAKKLAKKQNMRFQRQYNISKKLIA